MQRTTKTPVPQAVAKTQTSSQPKPLDVRELAQVSGGLPRGGGWAACAVIAPPLPRGGGW